jgi:hypothetical protein
VGLSCGQVRMPSSPPVASPLFPTPCANSQQAREGRVHLCCWDSATTFLHPGRRIELASPHLIYAGQFALQSCWQPRAQASRLHLPYITPLDCRRRQQGLQLARQHGRGRTAAAAATAGLLCRVLYKVSRGTTKAHSIHAQLLTVLLTAANPKPPVLAVL